VLSDLLRLLALLLMRLTGWRVEGRLPDLPKFVLVGAPHTSNWDFLLFLGAVFVLRADVRFMGKAELFRSPLGWFFRYCGGYPVDRKKPTGLVEQMVEAINQADTFILTITPEGTRGYVTDWKRGFYHIATGAGIPSHGSRGRQAQNRPHPGGAFLSQRRYRGGYKSHQKQVRGVWGHQAAQKVHHARTLTARSPGKSVRGGSSRGKTVILPLPLPF
jgi:1-acyl-sn-glycerol-3-phosphate acyltransferase